MGDSKSRTGNISYNEFNDIAKTSILCSMLINQLSTMPPEMLRIHTAVDRDKLDKFYWGIICAAYMTVREAFAILTPRGKHRTQEWNRNVAYLHEFCKAAYVLWRDAGQPQAGLLDNEIINLNDSWKYALRCCEKYERRYSVWKKW